MKIVALETVRPAVQPNLLFLLLRDEAGATGLGEAFFGAGAVETYLHETVAPLLLAAADVSPEGAARLLQSYVGYQGAGVETRGNAAVDLALWDLLGHRTGLPLARLLGGPVRNSIRAYNTCAGPSYIRASSRQASQNWGVGADDDGRYEDLRAFLTRPGELALDLRSEGYTAMKVWPFDIAAERTDGTDISTDELRAGVGIIAAIRDSVGDDLDVMVELHGLWHRAPATRIIRALAPHRPFWVEDPIRPDAVDAISRLRDDVEVPLAMGETAVGRRGFLTLLQRGALDVATLDIQWSGGVTEARKTAALADAYGVPVAPHDCTGPATLAACVHLVLSQPNGMIQETARAFIHTWYGELVSGVPQVVDGAVHLPEAPGHGVRVLDGVRDDAVVRQTAVP